MEDIDRIFQAALGHFMSKRGEQATLAARTNISTSNINDILKGRRGGTEEKKRAMAAALGYPGRRYEDFLDVGRALLACRPIPEPPPEQVKEADLAAIGCFKVPLDPAGRPAAEGLLPQGPGEPWETSSIVVYGPALGRKSGHHLRAFVVGDDSMEPLLAHGGLVVADLTKNRAEDLKEGSVYVVRYDEEGAVKYLRWAEKGRLLAIESENKLYQPVFRKVREVALIGRVIWSCRGHK